MIVLDVKKYCESCMDFQPDVTPPERLYTSFDDGDDITVSDTIVKCKYRKRCAGLVRYLEQQMKK